MMEYVKEKQQLIRELLEKYTNLEQLHDDIAKNCSKILMSKDKRISLYGMFLPDQRLEYIVTKYQGTLTKNPDKMNYRYYFDIDDRVVLTERHYGGNLLEYIFYFYENDYVNIVWYDGKDKRVINIAQVQYVNNEIYSFFEARIMSWGSFRSCVEYIFDYKDGILELIRNSYSVSSNGTAEKRTKIERYTL